MLAACSVCAAGGRAIAASPAAAEYAIRWDPVKGGPKTSAEAVKALDDKADEEDDFEIRYFDLERPGDAPAGSSAIVRERVKNAKKHELTVKYRAAEPLRKPKCPLPDPSESKSEIDVSLTKAEPKRVYSYSCTLESKTGPIAVPAELHAKPKSCSSTMHRVKTKTLGAKVEEWHLPGDLLMLEVSRSGSDTKADLAKFEREIADPLLAAGVEPSDRSKTELGGDCPE